MHSRRRILWQDLFWQLYSLLLKIRSLKLLFRAIPSTYRCVQRVFNRIPTFIRRRACLISFRSPIKPHTVPIHFNLHDCLVLRERNIVVLQVYPTLCPQIWASRFSHISMTSLSFRRCSRVWGRRLESWRIILKPYFRWGWPSVACFLNPIIVVASAGVLLTLYLPIWTEWSSKAWGQSSFPIGLTNHDQLVLFHGKGHLSIVWSFSRYVRQRPVFEFDNDNAPWAKC